MDRRNRSKSYYFFLEADRGTMPVKRRTLTASSIYRKALAYLETSRQGALKAPLGIPAFRVLFVTESAARLRHLREVCREANQGRETPLFLFALAEEVRRTGNLLRLPWATTAPDESGSSRHATLLP